MPVGFIQGLKGRMRRIAATFMHRFLASNGIGILPDADEYDMIEEWLMERASDEGEEEETRNAIQECCERYREDGDIYNLFQEINACPNPVDLDSELQNYKPRGRRERQILECFRSGMQFIGGENIMNFNYDCDKNEIVDDGERDYYPVYLDRTIQVVFHLSDYFSDGYNGFLNDELRDVTYPIYPASWKVVRPETDSLFTPCDYPERFSEWFIKTVETISEDEPDYP